MFWFFIQQRRDRNFKSFDSGKIPNADSIAKHRQETATEKGPTFKGANLFYTNDIFKQMF
jgi:hypothetical protein